VDEAVIVVGLVARDSPADQLSEFGAGTGFVVR
jgi:hypothetical protein